MSLNPARLAFCTFVASVALSADGAGAETPRPAFAFNEWLVAPVRVHLLSASNGPAIHTTLTTSDVERILKKMNGVWSQAGISFWLESLVREESLNQGYTARMGLPDDLRGLLSLRPEASRATNLFHLYYVKRFSANGVYLGEAMFVKDSAKLETVPGGIDEPLPRVSSHELGHALSLQHHTNRHHLMYRGTTGTNLDAVEIRQARAAAQEFHWIERASELFKRAGELRERKNAAEARRLYSRLTVIPLDEPPIRLSRQRER
jgi:hypothetical protein